MPFFDEAHVSGELDRPAGFLRSVLFPLESPTAFWPLTTCTSGASGPNKNLLLVNDSPFQFDHLISSPHSVVFYFDPSFFFLFEPFILSYFIYSISDISPSVCW